MLYIAARYNSFSCDNTVMNYVCDLLPKFIKLLYCTAYLQIIVLFSVCYDKFNVLKILIL